MSAEETKSGLEKLGEDAQKLADESGDPVLSARIRGVVGQISYAVEGADEQIAREAAEVEKPTLDGDSG